MIPQNMEKYLSLTVGRLKFIDSFQFTPESPDSLVKTLEDIFLFYLLYALLSRDNDIPGRVTGI